VGPHDFKGGDLLNMVDLVFWIKKVKITSKAEHQSFIGGLIQHFYALLLPPRMDILNIHPQIVVNHSS
jgi:hypothetical protein